ncbi:MAG: phosphoglycerate kinase [Candidatus Woesearchaeota archaeon]
MKLLKEAQIDGKRVLLRVDYNVVVDNGKIVNDNRLKATLPTLQYLMQNHAKTIIVTHMGRPDGKTNDKYRLDPVAKHLGTLLAIDVKKCSLEEAQEAISSMKAGDVIMLENIRFYPEEEKNDREFARRLAALADTYVNDAFAVCHRDNASVSAITEFLPSFAGLLLEKEVKNLSGVLDNPEKPYFAIIGGAKLETKIAVIENLAKRTDKVLLGGAMIFPFYRAKGYETGKSLIAEKEVPLAKKLLDELGRKLLLPTDIVLDNGETVECNNIPKERAGLDIGHRTLARFAYAMRNAKTVVWNGPMGKFEDKAFAKGTIELAKVVSELQATTVIGGGETVAAVEEAGLTEKFTLVSTGGGAALEFLEGKKLPGIAALD